jgi:hypothetical protein
VKSALHPARALLLALALLLGAAGCATLPRPTSPREEVAAATVCDRLYFGRAIPGGGEVTDADWAAFVAEVIVPRFPAGFTVYRAAGHWRGADGRPVDEATLVLEVVHGREARDELAVREIAELYRQRFQQEAVMRVRVPAARRFYPD